MIIQLKPSCPQRDALKVLLGDAETLRFKLDGAISYQEAGRVALTLPSIPKPPLLLAPPAGHSVRDYLGRNFHLSTDYDGGWAVEFEPLPTPNIHEGERITQAMVESLTTRSVKVSADNTPGMVLVEARVPLEIAEKMVRLVGPPPPTRLDFSHMLAALAKSHGTQRADLLAHKHWVDPNKKRIYLTLRHVEEMLSNSNGLPPRRGRITTTLRQLGGAAQFMLIDGKGRNCWWVPLATLPSPKPPAECPPTYIPDEFQK